MESHWEQNLGQQKLAETANHSVQHLDQYSELHLGPHLDASLQTLSGSLKAQ